MDEPLLQESWADETEGRNDEDRSELPSWLEEENDSQHVASVSGKNEASREAPTSSTSWADDGADAAVPDGNAWDGDATDGRRPRSDGANFPKALLGLRIANVGTAVLLMASSITVMTTVLTWPPTTPARWVLAAYATMGGLLLICLESPFSALRTCVALNFGFLYNPLLRFIFHALMCSITWSFHTLLGNLTVVALAITAPVNAYCLCMHQSLTAERDAALKEEERLIEARVREERRRAMREIAERWADGNL
uniref:Uncharacterized protein n=1 Tax=Pseudictyota dubia TaxID=2749911 RepID=A0A7R9WCL4_9STRA|mmetsp:Transcript_42268/g.78246  ORF Transcript_42268/g.78246 Transcript_42268/m.78246 type:complete len:253 (+) Transcript_42268:102-860(+)|eukprot:CAMPEP_0197436296 /NCGR_PEP_ID=MMETSP1175-20131217/3763_1 /TAXON_ID=1003142 /ORGANISM="Triceratium dubium, Strain CCMP147" /LENGTH=252 /DNA_ID=CAMNT_0042965551 /DNA_START=99 /DNA_END=857 /DNA_ORIENTATION=+